MIAALKSTAALSSRELRFVVEPLNLVCPIDPAADHLNGCSYLLFRRQPVPRQTASCNVAQSVKTPAPSFRVAGCPAST